MTPVDGDDSPFLLSRDDGKPPKQRGNRTKVIVVTGTAAVAVAGIVGARLVLGPLLAPDDFEGTGTGAVTVEIKPGQTAGQIAETLSEAGVVATARSFVRVVRQRDKENSLRPGRYRLNRGMAAGAALDQLVSGKARLIKKVAVPEGMRVNEALARLVSGSGIPLAHFQRVIAQPLSLGLPQYAKGQVEGFLFPATYEIESDTTAQSLLTAMVARYRRAAEQIRLEENAAKRKLTPLQALTVASIIQAEGGRDEDYPKIARVIYNRLAKGAKLEMDSTVLYAQGRHSLRVSAKDIKVSSPYNTYRHTGLPPGPIGSSGEKALHAALHPAKGDWYWFVTTDPGRRITKFTDKEAEFVKYREELNRYLGAD
ncbi:ABC transporter substrate-binding protein [Acrocarpospora pleiomorpha]|uniref:Endolytic murein transglycosylase n=1 Tax=Acrocarpospora pleiomorpha TaxID=90975 RepID=A0A5M3XPX1_9ACTN|nr:endolytic transglycosylase MltG [Acrocarpospora pleiomorpha]GES21711.1 ABC transporter substrate-binding protein [Acrocarpospora pleiomorpha]